VSGKTPDIVIVGAGIVGSSCAAELAAGGASVLVLEGDTVGGGATAAGMGHLVVMDDSEEEFALTRYSRQLWLDLAPELPRPVEFERCGTIWVAADDEEMTFVTQKHGYYGTRGVATEILDSQALREAEPHLRPGLMGGLLVTEDCVLYAPVATRWLLDKALLHGARLRPGVRAVKISTGEVKLSNGETIRADLVVNAAGAESPKLMPDVPVRPRKGHLAITARYPGFVRHQVVELGYLKSAHGTATESVAFNVQPRATGQVLIGSSRQFGRDDRETNAPILSKMLVRAIEYMPDLADLAVIRTWTGFRPATSDALPLVGPHTQLERVYLATGHEGLGITTSLGTGRLLADQILGRPPAIPVEPYLPSRFAGASVHA
jgi:glycine/D-amino acid oxidase-like deaminating enzyme